ncbi:uncharacterized protein LOC124896569 [Capsicum annuum]|uniref:uncharacterized protein LOC124896569 n=1 Tax=Capsicum annuum TaxID=4072 RepID=UPI001FB0EB36|nr:uncharacterized protein LOC124896569 [Capsicum annuum]
MGKSLSFVPPIQNNGKPVVTIDENDIRAQEDYWVKALIEYVIGDIPYVRTIENYVEQVWNFVPKPQILYHDDGYYMFRFNTVEDRDRVMQAGPYTFHNKSFILQHWKIDFDFNPECIRRIPLWVQFPGLPVGYWSTEALSKISSVVGKPLYTDKVTAEMERISYARVLIKTDVSRVLPKNIELIVPIGAFQQRIKYEWKPKFCHDCLKLSHKDVNCWKRARE